MRVLHDRFEPGITLGEAVLATHLIEASGRGERYTISDWAHRLQLPVSSVSRWIQVAVTRGLVELEPDPNDDRKRLITVREEAKEHVRRHYQDIAPLIRDTCAELALSEFEDVVMPNK